MDVAAKEVRLPPEATGEKPAKPVNPALVPGDQPDRPKPVEDRFGKEREVLAQVLVETIQKNLKGELTPDGIPSYAFDILQKVIGEIKVDGKPLDPESLPTTDRLLSALETQTLSPGTKYIIARALYPGRAEHAKNFPDIKVGYQKADDFIADLTFWQEQLGKHGGKIKLDALQNAYWDEKTKGKASLPWRMVALSEMALSSPDLKRDVKQAWDNWLEQSRKIMENTEWSELADARGTASIASRGKSFPKAIDQLTLCMKYGANSQVRSEAERLLAKVRMQERLSQFAQAMAGKTGQKPEELIDMIETLEGVKDEEMLLPTAQRVIPSDLQSEPVMQEYLAQRQQFLHREKLRTDLGQSLDETQSKWWSLKEFTSVILAAEEDPILMAEENIRLMARQAREKLPSLFKKEKKDVEVWTRGLTNELGRLPYLRQASCEEWLADLTKSIDQLRKRAGWYPLGKFTGSEAEAMESAVMKAQLEIRRAERLKERVTTSDSLFQQFRQESSPDQPYTAYVQAQVESIEAQFQDGQATISRQKELIQCLTQKQAAIRTGLSLGLEIADFKHRIQIAQSEVIHFRKVAKDGGVDVGEFFNEESLTRPATLQSEVRQSTGGKEKTPAGTGGTPGDQEIIPPLAAEDIPGKRLSLHQKLVNGKETYAYESGAKTQAEKKAVSGKELSVKELKQRDQEVRDEVIGGNYYLMGIDTPNSMQARLSEIRESVDSYLIEIGPVIGRESALAASREITSWRQELEGLAAKFEEGTLYDLYAKSESDEPFVSFLEDHLGEQRQAIEQQKQEIAAQEVKLKDWYIFDYSSTVLQQKKELLATTEKEVEKLETEREGLRKQLGILFKQQEVDKAVYLEAALKSYQEKRKEI